MTRKNNNSPLACLDKGERNYSPLEGGWGVLVGIIISLFIDSRLE